MDDVRQRGHLDYVRAELTDSELHGAGDFVDNLRAKSDIMEGEHLLHRIFRALAVQHLPHFGTGSACVLPRAA